MLRTDDGKREPREYEPAASLQSNRRVTAWWKGPFPYSLGGFKNFTQKENQSRYLKTVGANLANAPGAICSHGCIAAIVPWALHPVIPRHLASALSLVLEPFFKTKEYTIQVLQRRLLKIPDKVWLPGGWTGKEAMGLIDHVVGDKHRFFIDGNGSFSSIYYEYWLLLLSRGRPKW